MAGIVLVVAICATMMVPAIAQPPAPFAISGWVNDSSGDPVNDPGVAITNTNTGESFVDVSANDELSFDVNGETVTTHTVNQDDMDAGGFEQNLTVEGTSGICGDVTCNGVVDTGDVILLSNFVGYPGYELNCTG